MKRYLLLIVILLFVACKDSKTDLGTATPAKKVKVPEGPLAQKLYANYHQTPANQFQIDENKLIEYAVNNNIDVTKSASGLYHKITLQDQGTFFVHGSPITAHYRGTTLDGKEFDSSHKRGKPMSFKNGQMIAGWNEALKMMNPGAKATLLIPSHLAYGERGFPGLIGPNEPLVFEIEIMPN